jgi:hypothetical protein
MLSIQISPYNIDSGRSIRALIEGIFGRTMEEYRSAGRSMENVNIDSSFISHDPDLWGFALLGRMPKKNIPEMGSFVKNGSSTLYDQQ